LTIQLVPMPWWTCRTGNCFNGHCRVPVFVALLLFNEACASEMQDSDKSAEQDMEDASHAIKGAGLHHTFGCYEQGQWIGSCDLSMATGKILHISDWSPNCDPWKFHIPANAKNNGNVTFTFKTWTCPESHRSPSGCGDFMTDPRNLSCKKKKCDVRPGSH